MEFDDQGQQGQRQAHPQDPWSQVQKAAEAPAQGQGNQGGYQQRQSNYQNGQGGGYQQRQGGQGGYGGGGYQKNQGGYQGNNGGGYQKGGFQGGQGGGYRSNFQRGGGGFQRREEELDGSLYKPYVGTGNKEAPADVMEVMRKIAAELEKAGYTLRSGGMDGPEDLFESSVTKKEIHLPWKGFANKESSLTFTPNNAKEIAKQFQPGFDGLKPVVQTFLAKNVRMIMGKDLKSPALFMITWSEDGAETLREKSVKTGNAGHAIAIASALRIPVFNLGKHDAEQRLRRYLALDEQHGNEKPQQLTEI